MSFDSRNAGSFSSNNARFRASFSSTKTTSSSNTMTSSTILEQRNSEAYAGASFEAVPSSIVSFHHPHSYRSGAFGSVDMLERSRRNTGSESVLLSPVRSRTSEISRTPSRATHFRFFSEQQLENAEGAASTLEYTDYDTDWDATPAYEQERLHMNPRSSRSSLRNGSVGRGPSSTRAQSIQSYGAMDNHRGRAPYDGGSPRSSSSSSQYTFRERIPIEVEEEVGSVELADGNISSGHSDAESEDGLLNDDNRFTIDEVSEPQYVSGKKAYHAEYLKPRYHDRFYPRNVPHLHMQRFYIAEEDMVVGIAGYRTSAWKTYIYNIFCCLTLGMLYILCKWIPRYKVKFCGSKTFLGKAEWVVVENQYSELSIINVKRIWYNRPLSTVLPLKRGLLNSRHYHHESEENPNIPILISFEYRYLTLIYSPLTDIFQTNTNWADPDWTDLSLVSRGLPNNIHEDRMIAFGKNSINLRQKTTSQILFDEALHPFYIFQIFSIILWMFDAYYYYATCIFIISVLSVIDTLVETKQSSERLSELSQFYCDVRVYRDGFWSQVPSSDLVPGDIYELTDPSLSLLPCDSILISGDCLVNESMLTGESVPVSKVAATRETMLQLLDDFMDTQLSSFVSKSFLFNGTKLIRVRATAGQSIALGMVARTGFSTTKGSLVRSMVFPKPTGFKFYEDSFKYIGYISIIALFGFAVSFIQFLRLGLDKRTMILRALDIITVVVPPALPASLSIGTGFALNRLKKKGIFCISPTRVNVGGKIDVMCFDKTGTLTEDGLDVLGVHVVQPLQQEMKISKLVTDVKDLLQSLSLSDCVSTRDMKAKNFLVSLLTCHSLRMVDGELLGDPLDFKMFQFTKWSYEEETANRKFHSLYEERHDGSTLPENSSIAPAIVHPSGNDGFIESDPSNVIGIVRSFEFLSNLRRMSVIVKPFSENVFMSFTKGAPEVIFELCSKQTLPLDYEALLHHYTHNGYRVIACAGKKLTRQSWLYSQKVSREEIESNLEFLGFIIFENKLKGTTKETLESLHRADIRTIMCTGDNVLTAISVGREAGLVESPRVFVSVINDIDTSQEGDIITWQNVANSSDTLDSVTLRPLSGDTDDYTLAVTGEVFRLLFKTDKSQIEEVINNILLKTSIYARMSPDEKHELVERLQSIGYQVGFCGDGANDCGALKAADIGISLSEAEASVAAPFTSRLFEISCVLDVMKEGRAALVTSFACFQYMSLYSATQFVTILILYSRGSNLGDFQFLYIDLFLIVPLAVFMSWSKPYEVLAKKRPTANLVSPKILIPLLVHIVILFVFQLVPWLAVQHMKWYRQPVVGDDEHVASSDNTILFFVSNFQYILVAVVLSVGPPYREPMSKNVGFIADVLVSLVASCRIMFLSPDSTLGRLFQLTEASHPFCLLIIGWVFLNYYAQLYIPPAFKTLFKKKRSSKKYKNILLDYQRLATA
ncbi:FAFR567Wp [Eremothecium gossypii FDAG1]|nr:FAFR567Wp [Eremothecium gossypii FDAG1]